ncbi:hypothetical protein [Actinoplanes teichomyceticus]|uniref:Uncharacterized protein n=1 Tax=Actinoplanes teichomyceticus TaxID=1867 RepID=A0A561WN83_ACTTI|nr:hypothetical protein [Actinoplanes teichomyceticus]TWG25332.1 hypothetical protein FHX34_101298 [Actinoplanes teichomyceticus]GIF10400.1 hypothetical protein Ate01nite_04320 [Actinoplanes teichomyceticus]
MVLTGAVRTSDSGHTRRRVLGTAGGLAGLVTLGGCGLFDDDPEPAPAPDPLRPVLDEALALAAAYDRVARAQPALAGKLTPLAEAHRAHAGELARVIGTTLPSGPAASSAAAGGADTTSALRRAELAAQKTAAALCRSAAAERAALVGSIAAARAAHAEALR